MPNIKEIETIQELNDVLEYTNKVPNDKLDVIVITATWSDSWRELNSAYDELTKKYPNDVNFFIVNLDESESEEEFSYKLRVQTLPSIKIYRNRSEYMTVNGPDAIKLSEIYIKKALREK